MEKESMSSMPQVMEPSKDCNGQPYYTLLKGEEIIFELTIDQASRSGFDVSSMVSLGNLKSLVFSWVDNIPIIGSIIQGCLADKRQGIFAVTNMRCLVSQVTVSGCSHAEKQRSFWAFPRTAMNQSVFYEKMYVKRCCATVPEFTLEVGLTIGNESESLKLDINEKNISSDAQALAMCAKVAELGEHANK